MNWLTRIFSCARPADDPSSGQPTRTRSPQRVLIEAFPLRTVQTWAAQIDGDLRQCAETARRLAQRTDLTQSYKLEARRLRQNEARELRDRIDAYDGRIRAQIASALREPGDVGHERSMTAAERRAIAPWTTPVETARASVDRLLASLR